MAEIERLTEEEIRALQRMPGMHGDMLSIEKALRIIEAAEARIAALIDQCNQERARAEAAEARVAELEDQLFNGPSDDLTEASLAAANALVMAWDTTGAVGSCRAAVLDVLAAQPATAPREAQADHKAVDRAFGACPEAEDVQPAAPACEHRWSVGDTGDVVCCECGLPHQPTRTECSCADELSDQPCPVHAQLFSPTDAEADALGLPRCPTAPTRTEAEQRVLDAMGYVDELVLRKWVARGWQSRAGVARAELARRGLT